MASPNARAALEASLVYGLLPAHQRQPWLHHALKLGATANRPEDGEIFANPEACVTRLKAYGFVNGCAFSCIRTGSGDSRNPAYRDLFCSFYGRSTQNKWGLEERKAIDSDGELLTIRQRDTANQRKDCKVFYKLTYKKVPGSNERHWRGIWRGDSSHEASHTFPLNPFGWKEHREATEEYQELLNEARHYRYAMEPYSRATKLLSLRSLGLVIDKRTYYNVIRHKPLNKHKPDTIAGLLQALDEREFRSCIQYGNLNTNCDDDNPAEETTDGQPMKKLTSIFFWAPRGRDLARRFCAGHTIIVDATFNTNEKRMPLLTAVGITNEGKTFPVAYAYIPGETAAMFGFFFECLATEIFNNGAIQPQVYLTDMASGVISAVDTHQQLPHGTKLQYCIWHAEEAIMAKVKNEGRYTSIERTEIKHQVWRFLQSTTRFQLEANRNSLIAILQLNEVQYLESSWRPKEQRVIHLYTNTNSNLCARATSRVESWHRVTHEVTNGQLSIEQSAHRLADKLNEVYTAMSGDEEDALRKAATGLDWQGAFQLLVGKISRFALGKVEDEWLLLYQTPLEEIDLTSINDNCCRCEARRQWSLPCRHLLWRCYSEELPIPLKLVHPRWWLNGPSITAAYTPEYGIHRPLVISPARTTNTSHFRRLMQLRDTLNEHDQECLDRQFAHITESVISAGILNRELSETAGNMLQPDSNEKPSKRHKKASRSTANKLQDAKIRREARKARQQTQDESILRRRKASIGNEIVVVPSSPPRTAPETAGNVYDVLEYDKEGQPSAQPSLPPVPPQSSPLPTSSPPLPPSQPIRKKVARGPRKRGFSTFKELPLASSSDPLQADDLPPLSTAPAKPRASARATLRHNYHAVNEGRSLSPVRRWR
jgi:hypothetical protein